MNKLQNRRHRHELPSRKLPALSTLAFAAVVGFSITAVGLSTFAKEPGGVFSAVRKALDELVSVDLDHVPCDRAVKELKRRANVLISLDTQSLTDVGLTTDLPITLHVPHITLRSALNLMTQAANLNLGWTVRDGAILVTTMEHAEDDVTMRHEVFDLVATRPNVTRDMERNLAYEELATLTMAVIEPNKWSTGQGPATNWLLPDHGRFVVKEMSQIHDECEDLFLALRQAIRTRPKRLRVGPTAKLGNEERLRRALEEKTAVNVVRTPLDRVLAILGQRHGIPIVVDPYALPEEKATATAIAEPVSIQTSDVTLKSVLSSLLKPRKLVAFVQNEVVFVTSPEKIPLEVVVYWTGDLVSGNEKDGEALMERIQEVAKKGRLDVSGGSCEWFRGNSLLVCLETADAQDRIFALLTAMRSKRDTNRPSPPAATPKASANATPRLSAQ